MGGEGGRRGHQRVTSTWHLAGDAEQAPTRAQAGQGPALIAVKANAALRMRVGEGSEGRVLHRSP